MSTGEVKPLECSASHHVRFCQQRVKRFEDKKAEDGTGDGHAASQALNKKYSSQTREARRAWHETLVNAKMESGQDPDDFFSVMYGCRSLHGEMGQTVHDKRYEDIILQAFDVEYKEARNASYEKRDFGLVDIGHMVHIMFVDSRLRPPHFMPIAGRGIAMQTTGHTNSDVRSKYCRGVGHLLPDCAILKVKAQMHRPKRWGQCAQT